MHTFLFIFVYKKRHFTYHYQLKNQPLSSLDHRLQLELCSLRWIFASGIIIHGNRSHTGSYFYAMRLDVWRLDHHCTQVQWRDHLLVAGQTSACTVYGLLQMLQPVPLGKEERNTVLGQSHFRKFCPPSLTNLIWDAVCPTLDATLTPYVYTRAAFMKGQIVEIEGCGYAMCMTTSWLFFSAIAVRV